MAGLEARQQSAVYALVEALAARSLLSDAAEERSHTLDDADLAVYADEIAFVRYTHDSAAWRFQQLRDALIVLRGSGPVFAELLRVGLRSGWRQVSVLTGDDPAAIEAAVSAARRDPRQNEYDAVLRRPGTLEYGRYEPDHAPYGRGEALDAVEEHFAESTTVALDVLDQPARTHTATAILTVLAFGATLGAPAVRHDLIDPGRLQHAWQTSRTELLPAFSAFHPDGNAPHQLWSRSACRLRDRLTALRPDRPDAVARALDKCLHLHLNRLGILSTQEAMLRALTARAIADWGLCPAGRAGPRSGAEPGR
ncbi:MAG TPA: lantibiotic dehydratase C-terminal domain-containing protein [Actinoplanes sp.]|nr:lantibiotic dehydratase C-terminal domain-containing protein [Actinoplanes sp.]